MLAFSDVGVFEADAKDVPSMGAALAFSGIGLSCRTIG